MEKLIGVMAADIQNCKYAIGHLYNSLDRQNKVNRRLKLTTTLLSVDILILLSMNAIVAKKIKELDKELKKTKGE